MTNSNCFVRLGTLTVLATAGYSGVVANPNVVMIIVDDYGRYDLSMTGSKLYETPNIDKLASESTLFNNAYVTYPRSVPSRFSIMTGMHCARPQKGIRDDERHIEASNFAIAESFKAAGYNTFICGKWHLNGNDGTTPDDKGFDTVIGAGSTGSTSSYFAPYNKNLKPEDRDNKSIVGMDDVPEGTYLTDHMSEVTASYIKEQHSDRPFFAVCSYYAVHTPLEGKPDIVKRYQQRVEKLGLGEDPMKLEEAGVVKTQQDNPIYAAMIESADSGIGLIIDALKESGQYDNTLIVFISDHGGLSNRGNNRVLATTNLPLKAGKGHLYEGGIRVPLFVHLPEQSRGRVSDQVVSSLDIVPTLIDICSLPRGKGAILDGVSLSPALNPSKEQRLKSRDLYWHKAAERPEMTGDYVSSAIRSGNYKLLDFYTQGRVELYDLSKDDGERVNIANENPQLTSELMGKIKKWRDEIGVIYKD